MKDLSSPIRNVPKKGTPESLLRAMKKVTVVSLIVVISLSAYGISDVYTRNVIRHAEEDAVNISRAIYEREKEYFDLVVSGGKMSISVDRDNIPILNRRCTIFLYPFDILKIKVYDAGQQVVFSTDPTIIGRKDSNSRGLSRALQGHNDSKLKSKDMVLDLAGERKLNVDVVETYVPIRDGNGNILGSFEIYRDVTRVNKEIVNVLTASLLFLTAILVSVFFVSYLLLHKGVNLIKEAQGELERNAITDGLTCIFNRRHIFSRAGEEFARSIRRQLNNPVDAGVGFIMIDIDFFKMINDRYGHQCGDEILQQVAETISGALRHYDIVGRYGGEEFLVVLPDAGFEQTEEIAKRIWSLTREKPFRAKEQELRVTISLGISSKMAGDSELERVLKRADDGLYRAKKEGRDRIAWVEG